MTGTLAIVIPCGPGDRSWVGLLPHLGGVGADEVVLCLSDGDRAQALPPAVRVVTSPAGRARQLNRGATCTAAPWLWFLHADTRLTKATIAAARGFLRDAPEAIGYFDLRFLDDGPAWTRLNEAGALVRSRLFGLPFGDQGFLMPRRVLDRLGGFDEALSSGEDHALVWRARQAGIPVRPLRAPIFTSARRYATHGWARTTLQHLLSTGRQAIAFSSAGASR